MRPGGRAPARLPTTARRAPSARCIAGAALLATTLPTTGVVAQAVRGTVIDADYRRPIAGAAVVLVDTLAAAVDSATTDTAGRFRLHAPGAGTFIVHVAVEGHLSYSETVRPGRPGVGGGVELQVEMPVISAAAARVMADVIEREAALRLPWEELCREPVRPWEAGVLVGVSRDRSTLEPVPRALVRLEPLDPGDPAADPVARTRAATATGTFWFCNVPPGPARVVARADGFAPDTSYATIRAGTISWYDALLRPKR